MPLILLTAAAIHIPRARLSLPSILQRGDAEIAGGRQAADGGLLSRWRLVMLMESTDD